VTSHGAFSYFGHAWQLQFNAPQGLSNHDKPSVADVAALIHQLRSEGIRAVFVENIRDPRLVQQIAEEAGARIGGTLYSGSTSTWLGMFPRSLYAITTALQP
jgi:zinc/manganese transport system substrate-binding protein